MPLERNAFRPIINVPVPRDGIEIMHLKNNTQKYKTVQRFFLKNSV